LPAALKDGDEEVEGGNTVILKTAIVGYFWEFFYDVMCHEK